MDLLFRATKMSDSYSDSDEDERMEKIVTQFDTVKLQYKITCPGCEYMHKLDKFNHELSEETKRPFQCKNCLGYFLLTTETLMSDCLFVEATFRPSREKQHVIIPSSVIKWGYVSNENDVLLFLLGNKFIIKEKHGINGSSSIVCVRKTY